MKFISIPLISAFLVLGSPLALQARPTQAEALHRAFAEISQQTCDDRSIVQASINYSVCTANAGDKGQSRLISASSSIVNYGDGIGYWYYPNGKVAAIRFFHTDEVFMFDGGGKLQAELIRAQKVMVNGQEQFQERSIKTNFTKSERDRLEKLAQDGGKDILSKFKQSQSIKKETPALWSHCKRIIDENVVRLEAIPNVKVTTSSRFSKLITPYPDRAANLDRRYVLAMEGSGVETVWKSNDLMTEITQEITNACVGTAAVTFGRDRTADSATVGLFPDGKIKKFTCAQDLARSTNIRPAMTWGEQACD